MKFEEFAEKYNLPEAEQYLKDFRGAVVVVKIGGTAIEDGKTLQSILGNIIFLKENGINVVLVHGGGKQATVSGMQKGKEQKIKDGQRYTDAETLHDVDRIFGAINSMIVEKIHRLGGQARGLHGREGKAVIAEKYKKADLGFVGEVVDVDKGVLTEAMGNSVPVVSCIGVGRDGQIFNINADFVATAVAGFLKADKMIILSNSKGVLRDLGDVDSLISTIKTGEIEDLKRNGIVRDGMIPKIDSCKKVVESGVKKAHILDEGEKDALLIEIFSDKGAGTQIVP